VISRCLSPIPPLSSVKKRRKKRKKRELREGNRPAALCNDRGLKRPEDGKKEELSQEEKEKTKGSSAVPSFSIWLWTRHEKEREG